MLFSSLTRTWMQFLRACALYKKLITCQIGQGSCGYGLLNQDQWPYWTVGALSTSNSFFEAGPLQGCGECFELQCVEDGPVRSNSRVSS